MSGCLLPVIGGGSVVLQLFLCSGIVHTACIVYMRCINSTGSGFSIISKTCIFSTVKNCEWLLSWLYFDG